MRKPVRQIDSNEARIEDFITASHILANEGILDSFGHGTVRSPTDPGILHAESDASRTRFTR